MLRRTPTLTRRLCAFLACMLSLSISAAQASSPDFKELEIDHALTFDLQTPHTKWAKPYVGGKTRVLFFADGTGTDPRECVELMQRFDIDAQAVFWANIGETNQKYWHGGKLGEERMLNLLKQKWDCFVFLGLPMTKIPIRQKELIVEAIGKGAGIVFVGAKDGHELPGKMRAATGPKDLAPGEVGDAYTVGRGRGINLPKPQKIDYYEGWQVDYDYQQERLGRAVLWAAGKEPRLRLELDLSPRGGYADGVLVLRPPLPGVLKARLSGAPSGGHPALKVTLRSPGRPPLALSTLGVLGSDAQFTLPKLPDGDWHVDASVMSSAGVETWATLPFRVASGRSAPVVSLDRNWGEPGGTISGKVFLAEALKPGANLRVVLLDRRRRELVRKDIAVRSDSLGFEFPILPWLPMLVTVEARLILDGAELARSYRYFHVTKRKQGMFNFVLWGTPQGTLAPYVEESLEENGVTVQYDWEGPPLPVSAHDISWVSQTTHIGADKFPDGSQNPFCWNDRRAVQKQLDAIRPTAAAERGSFVYSLGDENQTRGSCSSPMCVDDYRSYLQESYGSLEALNRSWGTRFAGWQEVGLSSPRDDDEQGSRLSKNYPRWFDRQAYKSWNYLHFCQEHHKSFQKLDPQARTGFDGAGGFATGDDLDLLVRSMGFWVPYPGLADEVVRSIAPRDFVRSNWIGGRDKTAGPLLRKYWRLVTLGADSVWWWMWSCIGDLHGFLAPDLRPFPEIKEVVEDTRVVRDGLGDLLLHSQMQQDRIGVLYSYPSVFAHSLDEGKSFGSYETAHDTLIKFIRSEGFQFNYLTDRMLRQGEVDLSNYRILFLPRTEAMGDREARAISSFVKQGGTLVADFRPGLYDEHCKRRARGVLDDLFGIKRSADSAARTVSPGQDGFSRKILIDGGVTLKGARAGRKVDGVPIWLSRKVEKGQVILLNTQMESLARPESCEMRRQIFQGGVPVYQVTGINGKKSENVEVTRWLDGGIEIVALLRKDGAQEAVTIFSQGKRYVYDLRARKKQGACSRFATTLLPNRASFFVLTDKPEPEPRITLDRKRVARGMNAKATISVPGAQGLHAIKMSVQAGDRHLGWQDQTLLVGVKEATVQIPVAFNDPTGVYRLTFTDLFTDEKMLLSFTVDTNH